MSANSREMVSSTEDRRYVAEEAEAGLRLDRFLASRVETISRARLQQLIREGHVLSGGKAVLDPNAKVRANQPIELTIPEAAPAPLKGQAIELDVVYEDKSLIVIDKPAGLVVHPGAGNPDGTLVNALIAHCGESLSGIGGVARPGIVHRLDKDTSGLMVIAKTDEAHQGLAAQFADHGRTLDMAREYLAIVWGEPNPRAGRIETEIARHPASRVKMAVVPSRGRHAVTHYKLEETAGFTEGARISRVRCRLETGRTHQVRVHMAHIGAPIVADDLYGAGYRTKIRALPERAAQALGLLRRQALHAALLRFTHPRTARVLEFESDLPAEIANLCSAFEMRERKMSKN